jgi:hypothetical protein
MGNTLAKKGQDKQSRKRELQVLILLTGLRKADAGQNATGRRGGVGGGEGTAKFDAMAKELGLKDDATMGDLNPSQIPSVDDIVHMADTGDIDSAFCTLQDRLLSFPDDVEAMTVSPPLSVLIRKNDCSRVERFVCLLAHPESAPHFRCW